MPSDQLQTPLLDARVGPLLGVLPKVLPTPGVHHVHGRSLEEAGIVAGAGAA